MKMALGSVEMPLPGESKRACSSLLALSRLWVEHTLSWKSPHHSLHDTIALLISSISSYSSQSLCSFLPLCQLLKYHCSLSFNHLCPCLSKRGLWNSSIAILWTMMETQTCGPSPRPSESESAFAQNSQAFTGTFQPEKCCFPWPLLILRISPKQSHLPLQLSSVLLYRWRKRASPAQLSPLSSLHVYGLCLFFVWVKPWGIWNLNALTGYQTRATCSRSAASWPLDHREVPLAQIAVRISARFT